MRGAAAILAAVILTGLAGDAGAVTSHPLPLDDTSPGWRCDLQGNRLCGAPGGSPLQVLTGRGTP